MSDPMALTPPTRENAKRWLADVSMFYNLEAAEVTTIGARKSRWLASLLDVVEFLSPPQEAGAGKHPVVNYLDPAALSKWVRDVVGDAELADRMDALIASGKGYAVLAPQIRELTLKRVVQCWELLKSDGE